MKKLKGKVIVILAVVVVLLLGLSTWYSIVFNDWRLVEPMDFSTYEFRVQDLPMIVSLTLVMLYVLYLGVLLCVTIVGNKERQKVSKTTRKINPRLGLLGFFGFLGFIGFWTYGAFHHFFVLDSAQCESAGQSGIYPHRLYHPDFPGDSAGPVPQRIPALPL